MSEPRFSPTKQKMVDELISGAAIPREKIWNCLYDDGGDMHNIHAHLSFLRTHLKTGYEIICQLIGRKLYYRIVKTLSGEDPFMGG